MLSFATGALIGLPQGFQKYQGLRQFTRYEDVPDVGEKSVVTGSDAIFEDVLGYATPTSLGYSYILTNEGEPVIDMAGSLLGQTFSVDLYKFMLRKWTGDTLFAVNNRAPVPNSDDGDDFHLQVGINPPDADLSTYWTDPEGDAFTVTVSPATVDALPSWATLVGNILVLAAPTSVVTKNVTMRATDIWGNTSDLLLRIDAANNVVVPNVVGLLPAAAEASLTANSLLFAYGDPQYTPTIGVGRVFTQTPPALTTISAMSVVALVLSLGPPLPQGGDAVFEYGSMSFTPDKSTTSLTFTGYTSYHKQRPPGITGVPSATPKKTPSVRSPASIGPQGRNPPYKGRK